MADDLDQLRGFANETQLRYLDALAEHKSARKAAAVLGVNPSTIDRSLQRLRALGSQMGHAPGHWDSGVAPGYRMGKVTVERTPEGVTRVWERQHPADHAKEERIRAIIDGACEDFRLVDPVKAPLFVEADLLTVYPVGDPHAGLYSWKDETGSHFDLAEFERVQMAAVDRLVDSTPPSAVALFNDKGDSTHADNSKNRTPKSGHELDVHGRHGEVMRVSFRVKRYQIARMLEKHQKVIFRVDPGNHDPESALALSLALEALYEREPRVEVASSPNPYWYLPWGSTLIGTCHGDGAKGKDLPGIMAHDARELWGAADYCVWFVGHVHHKDITEYTGCTVEYVGTLAAPDHYSHHKGFRSRRTLEAVTFHRRFGEVERHTCNLKMLEAA